MDKAIRKKALFFAYRIEDGRMHFWEIPVLCKKLRQYTKEELIADGYEELVVEEKPAA